MSEINRRQFLKRTARIGGLAALMRFMPHDKALALYQTSAMGKQPVLDAGGGASCSGNYGYTTTPGTWTGWGYGAGSIMICRIPLSCNGTIASISAYLEYSHLAVTACLYEDDGSGTDPAALIGSYGSATYGSPAAWRTDSSVGAVITGTPTYIWAGFQKQNGTTGWYFDTGSIPYREYTGTYGVFPDPWPTGSDNAGTMDLGCYVTV